MLDRKRDVKEGVCGDRIVGEQKGFERASRLVGTSREGHARQNVFPAALEHDLDEGLVGELALVLNEIFSEKPLVSWSDGPFRRRQATDFYADTEPRTEERSVVPVQASFRRGHHRIVRGAQSLVKTW
jgi:hypothetical protein